MEQKYVNILDFAKSMENVTNPMARLRELLSRHTTSEQTCNTSLGNLLCQLKRNVAIPDITHGGIAFCPLKQQRPDS